MQTLLIQDRPLIKRVVIAETLSLAFLHHEQRWYMVWAKFVKSETPTTTTTFIEGWLNDLGQEGHLMGGG